MLLQYKYQYPYFLAETVEVEESGETRGDPSTANLAREGGRGGVVLEWGYECMRMWIVCT